MGTHDLDTLMATLEATPAMTPEVMAATASAIEAGFPGRALWSDAKAEVLGSTDGVLGLIAAALPSWSLHIKGASVTAHGRWTCTIRETGVRDDDELIGVGKADSMANALLSALLKIAQLKRK